MTTTPRRIEWTGPEGWTVWADEDGVHVRTPKGDGLEPAELSSLIGLVSEALRQTSSGHVPAPKPLTREQFRELHGDNREAYAAKRAQRAIAREFAPETTPF